MALFPYDIILVDDLAVTDSVSLISSDTRSKQYLTRRTLGQRFEVSMSCRVLPWNFQAANAYVTSLRGGATVTQITLPFYGDTTAPDTSVAAAPTLGARAVTLASVTGVVPGLYMQFGSHTKVYSVTSVVGNVVNFEPNLIRAAGVGTSVKFNGVQIHCKLRGAAQSFSSVHHRMPITRNLDFVEVIG
jgi:hypothetical protein